MANPTGMPNIGQAISEDQGRCTRPWYLWFQQIGSTASSGGATGPTGPSGAAGPTGVTGPTGPGGVGVPYFIASGDTFTVPVFMQALWAMTIDNEGTLVVNGFLIQVD